MSFPKPEETLSLALRSGEVVEVDSVRVTVLNQAVSLTRVEWVPRESINQPGRVIYGQRWEGSRKMLVNMAAKLRELTPQEDWLLDKVLP